MRPVRLWAASFVFFSFVKEKVTFFFFSENRRLFVSTNSRLCGRSICENRSKMRIAGSGAT